MFLATQFIEAFCFILAVILLHNTNDKRWKVVKWFMLFAVITEGILTLTGTVYHKNNTWLVNLYTLINFCTINWLMYRFLPYRKINVLLYRIITLLFFLCFACEILYKGIDEYVMFSNLLSDIFLFILSNRYFYLLLKEDSWIDIHKHAAFWFVTGIFLFNLCAVIADVFDEQLMSLYIFSHIPLYYLLYLVFNLILYSCWSFAFICKYRETISS